MACAIEYDSQFIDNELTLNSAISELNLYKRIRADSLLAVDCEGVSLSRKGELTILSVATREKAYIFDVMKIGKAIFSGGLREILEDNTQEKLTFDCRQDSDALWHQFNVKLAGVLDLQLLEIMYRRENFTNTSADDVERINGYRRCLELYLKDNKLIKAKDRGAELFKSNQNAWKNRPLSETLIEYCVVDTKGMFKLYDKIKNHLRRSSGERTRLKVASQKYVDHYREKSERFYDDYECNGFLPLHIIPEKGTTTFPSADTSCTGCKRQFPREEFRRNQLRNGEQKCRVCKEVKRVNDVQLYRWDGNDNFDFFDNHDFFGNEDTLDDFDFFGNEDTSDDYDFFDDYNSYAYDSGFDYY